MELKIEIDTARVLTALLKAPQEFSREVRTQMKREMTAVQTEARQNHRFTARSGGAGLEGAIKTEVTWSGFSGRTFIADRLAKYGKYVHGGTGIYGPKRRPIRPIKGKFLVFPGRDGRKVFAKEVKGQRPDPFLFKAFNKRKQILVLNINKAIQRGFKRAGV